MLKIVFFKQRILNASLYNLAHALLFYIRLHMKQMRLHGTVVDERDRLCSEVFLKDPSLDPLLFQRVLFCIIIFPERANDKVTRTPSIKTFSEE